MSRERWPPSSTTQIWQRPQLQILPRWQHWQVVNRVSALYDKEAFADGPTQRAIVGYLKACPKDDAAAALDRIRLRDPSGVEAAEKVLLLRGIK